MYSFGVDKFDGTDPGRFKPDRCRDNEYVVANLQTRRKVLPFVQLENLKQNKKNEDVVKDERLM
jgi:hypothetical protein